MLPVSTKYHYPILKLLADGKAHTSKEMQDVLIKEFALTEEDLKIKTNGGEKSKGSLLFPKWVGFAIKNLRDANFIITKGKDKNLALYQITEDGKRMLEVCGGYFVGGTGKSLLATYKKLTFGKSKEVPKQEPIPEEKPIVPKKKDEGFVYILTNDAFKANYIKIGYTTDLDERLRSLYNTSVPKPFKVYALLKTRKYKFAEKLMHETFRDYRTGDDREFFLLIPEVALEQLKVVAEGLDAVVITYDDKGNEKKIFDYSK